MHLVVPKAESSRQEEGEPSNRQHDPEGSSWEAIDVFNIHFLVANIEYSSSSQSGCIGNM